jgi:hypothetical protein
MDTGCLSKLCRSMGGKFFFFSCTIKLFFIDLKIFLVYNYL